MEGEYFWKAGHRKKSAWSEKLFLRRGMRKENEEERTEEGRTHSETKTSSVRSPEMLRGASVASGDGSELHWTFLDLIDGVRSKRGPSGEASSSRRRDEQREGKEVLEKRKN